MRNAQGRRIMLDLDLNNPPPYENMGLCNLQEEHDQGNGCSQGQATYDVEATKNSRRGQWRTERPDEALTDWLLLSTTRHRTSNDQTDFNLELSLNFEDSNKTLDVATDTPMPPVLPQSQSLLEGPTFTCGICMDSLIEETSTKCGHIFCKKCIEAAIATQRKCPTCRHKLRKRDTIRVYLPTFS